MASNEELVLRLQQGNTEAAAALWEQNRGLVCLAIRRYRELAQRNKAVDDDDLMQCAFLGVLEAVRAYDACRGAFTTLLPWYVKRECRKALGLIGRPRAEHYESMSTETPLAEGLVIIDTLEDTGLPGISERLELEALQQDVRAAVDELPEKEQEAIRRLYLTGQSVQAVADGMGESYSRMQSIKHRALRKLHRNRILHSLYAPQYYRHKGVSAFYSSRSSTVEDLVLWLEERTARVTAPRPK